MRFLAFVFSTALISFAAEAQFPANPLPIQSIQLLSEREEVLAGTLLRPDFGLGGIIPTTFQLQTKSGLINVVFDQALEAAVASLMGKRVFGIGIKGSVALQGPPFVAEAYYVYELERDFRLGL